MDVMTGNKHHLKFWHPVTREEIGRVVTSVTEVQQQTEVAYEMYRSEGVDYYPGIALWSDPDDPANSLTIGAAPDGYAVIYTDEEYLQTVTTSGRAPDGVFLSIQLDDFIEVPSRCFIEKQAALDIVAHWMTSGSLPESAEFTNELYE